MPAENIFTKKPVISLLFVTFIMSLLLILLLEAILRFTPYKIFVEAGQGGAFPPMFVADKETGFDLAKNYKGGKHTTIETEYSVSTNNISCFDSDVKIDKKHNIIIGDSFTWGFSPLNKKWTSIIERDSGQRIVKCGVPAYGPKQTLLKLKKIVNKIGKTPKTILYAYYWNDLNDDHMDLASTVFEGNLINRIKSFDYSTGDIEYFSERELIDTYQQYKKYGDSDYQSLSTYKKVRFWIKTNSIIANLIHSYTSSLTPPEIESVVKGNTAQYKTYLTKMSSKEFQWLKPAWNKHLENLENLSLYAKSVNSKFMILLIPNKEHVYATSTTEKSMLNLEQSRTKLKTFFNEKNILYFDLFDGFSKVAEQSKNLYLSNDLHFSIEGEALAGELLSDFVTTNNFLEAIKTNND